jgi:hypothetical protein
MESMRSTWTDGRLDDLNDRVGELSQEMHALQRTIIQVGAVLTAATLVVLAAMLGLIGVFVATQL